MGLLWLGLVPQPNLRRDDRTRLCLPLDMIGQLGLKLLKEVPVAMAMGIRTARIYRDATIFFMVVKERLSVWSCRGDGIRCWG